MSYQEALPPGDASPSSGRDLRPGAAAARTTPASRRSNSWRLAARDFLHHRMGMVGLAIIVVMALFSFVGPIIYRTNQVSTNLLQINLPPSSQFPLGTDPVGYNILGRLMVAGRPSLEVGLAAAAIAAIFGTLWGAIAGFVGGWLDAGMMRIVDGFVAIPTVLLVLLLATIVTPSVGTMILILGFVSWLITARLVRSEVLVLRTLDYVKAAEDDR